MFWFKILDNLNSATWLIITDLSLEAAMICDMCNPLNTPKQIQYWFDIGKYWECRQPTFWDNPLCSKKTARFGVHGFNHELRIQPKTSKSFCPTAVELHFQSPKWHHLQSDQWQSAKPPSPVCKNGVAKMPLFMGPCSCYTPGKLRWNPKKRELWMIMFMFKKVIFRFQSFVFVRGSQICMFIRHRKERWWLPAWRHPLSSLST